MQQETTNPTSPLQENFEDFFEQSLCGFIITSPAGLIVRANTKMAVWTGCTTAELKGKKFSDLLAIGGKIYYETHLGPLLRMQGSFDEVLLELSSAAGFKVQVLVNAFERRNENNELLFSRYTLIKASDRLQYEQNLQQAKTVAEEELFRQVELVGLREQLIAVLGHDLRNPLSSIFMATDILQASLVDEENAELLVVLRRSAHRMAELVNNIMDFARTRLGEGIVLARKQVMLKPVLQQVISELQLSYPGREIITAFAIPEPVDCDPHRVSQLFSNLLANALTHGDEHSPVYIRASQQNAFFELAVINKGEAIPAAVQEQLFAPFARKTDSANQQGLGLGLYIAKEIAVAHHGVLECISNPEETCFTFRFGA